MMDETTEAKTRRANEQTKVANADLSLQKSFSERPREYKALWGLVCRRARWGLSRTGWLTVVGAALLFGSAAVLGVHSFLAINRPVNGDYLVVEGWLPDYALVKAQHEFVAHPYKQLFATGGPLSKGSYLLEYGTYAEVTAATLRKLGTQSYSVQAVPARARNRHRTYESAIALREWVKERNINLQAINVMTLGAHARRTRLAYQQVFGDSVEVGIIPVPEEEFDSRKWWVSSAGVKTMIGEMAGYLYARFFRASESAEL